VGAVSYFVRMVAKPGQAEAVKDLLLTNPRRIEQGEPGNLAFGVHRSTDNPNEFWLLRDLGERGRRTGPHPALGGDLHRPTTGGAGSLGGTLVSRVWGPGGPS
jgi:hypothetical protein